MEQALGATSDSDYDLAIYLGDLCVILCRRFERTGCMEDIDRAIKTAEQAVKLTSDDDFDGEAIMVGFTGSSRVHHFHVEIALYTPEGLQGREESQEDESYIAS